LVHLKNVELCRIRNPQFLNIRTVSFPFSFSFYWKVFNKEKMTAQFNNNPWSDHHSSLSIISLIKLLCNFCPSSPIVPPRKVVKQFSFWSHFDHNTYKSRLPASPLPPSPAATLPIHPFVVKCQCHHHNIQQIHHPPSIPLFGIHNSPSIHSFNVGICTRQRPTPTSTLPAVNTKNDWIFL
jgi:hypothetical protein